MAMISGIQGSASYPVEHRGVSGLVLKNIGVSPDGPVRYWGVSGPRQHRSAEHPSRGVTLRGLLCSLVSPGPRRFLKICSQCFADNQFFLFLICLGCFSIVKGVEGGIWGHCRPLPRCRPMGSAVCSQLLRAVGGGSSWHFFLPPLFLLYFFLSFLIKETKCFMAV